MSNLLVPRKGHPSHRPTETSESYTISGSIRGEVEESGVYRNFPSPLNKVQKDLVSLMTWPEGWNGYDAAKPRHDSIQHAYRWLASLYRDVNHQLWIRPNVVADAEGDVVFEWWHNKKKLTVYVSPETIEFIKVEGPDINTDMYDGVSESARDSRILWHWLLS